MLVYNISRWKGNCVNHLDSLSFGQRVNKTYFIYYYVNYTQRARGYSFTPVLQTVCFYHTFSIPVNAVQMYCCAKHHQTFDQSNKHKGSP